MNQKLKLTGNTLK